jgi:GNAT superfamily N-acetyltransferase
MNPSTGMRPDATPIPWQHPGRDRSPRPGEDPAGSGPSEALLADLNQNWETPDGTRMVLRAMSPQDAPALGELFATLSPADRRRRFQGAVNALPQAWLERLAGVDQRRHVALAVTTADADAGPLIAEARWAFDGSGSAAEFALSVAPQWRRRGIGERCIGALLRAAGRQGLDWLHGTVLAENEPMLAFARHCGFLCTPSRADAALVTIEVRVAAPPAGRERSIALAAARRLAMRRSGSA